MASDWTLTPEDCTRLYFLAELLALQAEGSPRVQLDLVPVHLLAEARPQFALLRDGEAVTQLSDAVNPLVIDPDGRFFPFTYGIDARLELGSLADTKGLALTPAMRALVTALLDAAFRDAQSEGMEYLDWFAHLTRVSRRLDYGRSARTRPATAPSTGSSRNDQNPRSPRTRSSPDHISGGAIAATSPTTSASR
jgi:hypothetical protein